jgi:hypothetical protein
MCITCQLAHVWLDGVRSLATDWHRPILNCVKSGFGNSLIEAASCVRPRSRIWPNPAMRKSSRIPTGNVYLKMALV